jgi:hypothetical protein
MAEKEHKNDHTSEYKLPFEIKTFPGLQAKTVRKVGHLLGLRPGIVEFCRSIAGK